MRVYHVVRTVLPIEIQNRDFFVENHGFPAYSGKYRRFFWEEQQKQLEFVNKFEIF
jgi:hypothetical protein